MSSSVRLAAFTMGWLAGSATRGADWMSSTNSRPAASSAAFTSSAVAEVSNSTPSSLFPLATSSMTPWVVRSRSA